MLTVLYYNIEWYVAWWFTLIFLFIEMGCETQPVISLWKALPISWKFGITAPMELHSLKISLKSTLTCTSCNNALLELFHLELQTRLEHWWKVIPPFFSNGSTTLYSTKNFSKFCIYKFSRFPSIIVSKPLRLNEPVQSLW